MSLGLTPNPMGGGGGSGDATSIGGIPIVGTPTTGSTLEYNAALNQFEWSLPTKYYLSGAAAAAGAPHIIGQSIVIYDVAAPSDPNRGTWQVTAGTGASFPGNYTKVSDAVSTASELAVLDSGNFFAGTDVEAVLQEVGGGLTSGPTGSLPIATTTILSVAITAAEVGDVVVELENGTLRYKTTLSVAHDDTSATLSEYNVEPGPGVTTVPVTFDADISAGNLRIRATATSTGWSYRVRRLALLAV